MEPAVLCPCLGAVCATGWLQGWWNRCSEEARGFVWCLFLRQRFMGCSAAIESLAAPSSGRKIWMFPNQGPKFLVKGELEESVLLFSVLFYILL